MRALAILQEQVRRRLTFVHAARFEALWRVVVALIVGRRLWLTALGRSLPTGAHPKHAIKAVDRLLGSRHLSRERFAIASAMADRVVPNDSRPVVLIDTTEIRHRVVAFTASVAHHGRSVPIWSTIVSAYRVKASQCRRFLRELSRVLPPTCLPILVTDAGFESAWLDEVERRGWDYVSRVRGQVKFNYRGERVDCHSLRRLAGGVASGRHLPVPADRQLREHESALAWVLGRKSHEPEVLGPPVRGNVRVAI